MKKINWLRLFNMGVCILFLLLPYYLFEGKLFIGGDDTRLFYSYPYEFLKNVSFFSWINVSTVGTSGSQQYLLPFVFIWSGLKVLIKNPVVISYLAFSLPLLLGFLSMQKFIREIFCLDKKFDFEIYTASLFYILSPILVINQLFVFLISVWLLFIIPAIGYLYLRYLKTANFRYIYVSMILSLIFSFTFFTMPWLFGFLLPLCLGLIALAFLSSKHEIARFIKLSFVYGVCVAAVHSFWTFGFLAPYIYKDENSMALKFVSTGFLNTFAPTVISTAKGFINYPLLNLFQRQIAFDFVWKLKDDFLRLYDKAFILNAVFIFLLGFGVFTYKKYLDKKNRKIYLFLFISFLLSLYFFTVNIGPLKDLFLLFGKIPGFIMFRNFYDKFTPGYVIFYSLLIAMSLVLLKKKHPLFEKKLAYVLIAVIFVNFSTVKSTVNSALWTTESVYRTITIPDEYLHFMNDIHQKVPSTNMILSVPFGTSVYTVIKDKNSDNVYVGISPIKIFSGVNDISGHLSFNFTNEANIIDSLILDRKYEVFNEILYNHAINYVLVTKNIPSQVLQSWIFERHIVEKQDGVFLNAITDKKILTSENGNYDLYITKRPNSLLESDNMEYKKINTVTYDVLIKNISSAQPFKFNDSYNSGWKLFLVKNPAKELCGSDSVTYVRARECKESFSFFNLKEMSYLTQKTVFDVSHRPTDASTNEWIIDQEYIKNNFSPEYYSINVDGSINIQFVLYYTPQLYFYYGVLVSCAVLLISSLYMVWIARKRKI